MLQDRGKTRIEGGGALRELDGHHARIFRARGGGGARQRIAAASGEPALRLAKRARVAGEKGGELRIAFRRRDERGGVLGDPLAQQRKLIRVLDIARARSQRAARWASSTSCLLPCATVADPFATSIKRC